MKKFCTVALMGVLSVFSAIFAHAGDLEIHGLSIGMNEEEVIQNLETQCQDGLWYQSAETYRIDKGYLPLQYGCELSNGHLIVSFLNEKAFQIKDYQIIHYKESLSDEVLFDNVALVRDKLEEKYGKANSVIMRNKDNGEASWDLYVGNDLMEFIDLAALCWGECEKINDYSEAIQLNGNSLAATIESLGQSALVVSRYYIDMQGWQAAKAEEAQAKKKATNQL